MARKRKNTRMFSREQRRQARAEQLERAKSITQEEVDASTLMAYLGSAPVSAEQIAEAWLALREEEDPTDLERQALEALGREFERFTGEAATVEAAEIAIEERDDFRDAYGAAMDERYLEPSLEGFITTDEEEV